VTALPTSWCRPPVGVLVGLLFRFDDLVPVACVLTCERTKFVTSFVTIPVRNCAVSATSYSSQVMVCWHIAQPASTESPESARDGRAPAASDPESVRSGNCDPVRSRSVAREVRDMSVSRSTHVLADLTAVSTIQRRPRENDIADVAGDPLCLPQRSLIIRA
jgi:hypothetical protein